MTAAAADQVHSYPHGNGNGSLVGGGGGGGDKSGISTLSSATGNGSLVMAAGGDGMPSGTLNKFSGNTSDVVSDSTRSRRCCVVM